jgi:hypothetical protein
LLILKQVAKYCSIVFAVTLIHGSIGDRAMANPRREIFRTITLLSDRSVYNPQPLPIGGDVSYLIQEIYINNNNNDSNYLLCINISKYMFLFPQHS